MELHRNLRLEMCDGRHAREGRPAGKARGQRATPMVQHGRAQVGLRLDHLERTHLPLCEPAAPSVAEAQERARARHERIPSQDGEGRAKRARRTPAIGGRDARCHHGVRAEGAKPTQSCGRALVSAMLAAAVCLRLRRRDECGQAAANAEAEGSRGQLGWCLEPRSDGAKKSTLLGGWAPLVRACVQPLLIVLILSPAHPPPLPARCTTSTTTATGGRDAAAAGATTTTTTTWRVPLERDRRERIFWRRCAAATLPLGRRRRRRRRLVLVHQRRHRLAPRRRRPLLQLLAVKDLLEVALAVVHRAERLARRHVDARERARDAARADRAAGRRRLLAVLLHSRDRRRASAGNTRAWSSLRLSASYSRS